MRVLRDRLPLVLAAALTILAAGATEAQAQAITRADIDRLEVMANDVGADITTIRSRNASVGDSDIRLEELREEVIYLKVKLRKGQRVTRAEYNDVRTRLTSLQSRTRTSAAGISGGIASGTSGGRRDRIGRAGEVPEGTEFDVRLNESLSSETAQVEQRFEAITAADIEQDGRILIPAGSRVRGVVSSVDRASRTDRRGRMTLAFDQIIVNERTYDLRGTVTQALQGDTKGEATKIGGGAGVGAIIGGILGGLKGAVLGAIIGAGGTVVATEGSDAKLDAGTILRVRLDEPLRIVR